MARLRSPISAMVARRAIRGKCARSGDVLGVAFSVCPAAVRVTFSVGSGKGYAFIPRRGSRNASYTMSEWRMLMNVDMRANPSACPVNSKQQLQRQGRREPRSIGVVRPPHAFCHRLLRGIQLFLMSNRSEASANNLSL